MGRYLSRARAHYQKIQFYHQQPDSSGYRQAEISASALPILMVSAQRSKGQKADEAGIRQLIQDAEVLMQDLKNREDAWQKRTGL